MTSSQHLHRNERRDQTAALFEERSNRGRFFRIYGLSDIESDAAALERLIT
jgi:hypothetical protein